MNLVKNPENRGLFISDELLGILHRAINTERNQRQLALKLGIAPQVLGKYLGITTNKINYIEWDTWESIREYFYSHLLIDRNDVRYLLPHELRRKVIDLQLQLKKLPQGNTTTIGDNNAVNSQVNGDKDFKGRAIMAITALNLAPEIQLKVISALVDL